MDPPNDDLDRAADAYVREHGAALPNNRGDDITDHTGRGGAGGESGNAGATDPSNPNFTVQRIRGMCNSLSKSTLNKHQAENERLAVYFWMDAAKHGYLSPELRRELGDVETGIDCTDLENRHRKYLQGGGKKKLAVRKTEHRMKLLRRVVGGFLGKPGTRPPRQAFNLAALSADVNAFLGYISDRVKADGSLMMPDVYNGFRSSLTYLFSRYDFKTPGGYDAELSRYMRGAVRIAKEARQNGEGNIYGGTRELPRYMQGAVRIAKEARQNGEGNIYVGARELPWNLYLKINQWFLDDGSPESLFAVAFAKTTCLLACRGGNTGPICTKHLEWETDSFFPLTHEKAHQDGGDTSKRLPGHCYSNLFDQAADYPSALFHYLAMYPQILANRDGPLFRGSTEDVSKAFSFALKKIVSAHSDEIEKDYNIAISDINTCSYRKCAQARRNRETTEGPSCAAACSRRGHSLGSDCNVCIQQEKVSNYYCGRIVSRLPVNEARFAVSFPDFVPIDVMTSMNGNGVSLIEFERKKKEVLEEFDAVLVSIFGRELLTGFTTITKFLRVGLASHLMHLEKIEEWLPAHAKIRQTPLFTNPAVAELKQHVRIAMPWNNHYKYFKIEPKGMSAHVSLLDETKAIKKRIDDLLVKFEGMLETRQMNGPIPLAEMRAVVCENEQMKMIEDILLRIMKNRGLAAAQSDAAAPSEPRFDLFNHPDKIKRRVPPNWEFPKLNLQHMYLLWHNGNEAQKVAPIKLWDSTDAKSVSGNRGKYYLSELRCLMKSIDQAATAAGAPPQKKMSHAEIITCYHAGKSGIDIPLETPSGRRRHIERMSWTTVLKELRQSQSRRRYYTLQRK